MVKIIPAPKLVADLIVWYGVFKGIVVPLTAIFNGELYGPGAFLAGAIAISTALFGELYFRDETDV